MRDIPNLKEVTYELTTNCGANCVMCVRTQYSKPGQNMTKEQVMQYTKKCVEAGYNAIILGGMGDPLAYPNIIWFLHYIKETYPHLSIRLTTTGQLLSEEMLNQVCQYVDILKISNYGYTKAIYESVHRGTLVFEKVQENLMRIAKVTGRKPYIIMSFLDLGINHEDVLPWVDYWSTQGLSEVNVWKPHNWGGYIGDREELSEELVYCERVRNKHFKVWVDGTVSACTFDCERALMLGNLQNDNFDSINHKYESIKAIHDSQIVVSSDLPCKHCDQIYSRDGALLYLNEYGKVLKDLIHNN